MAKATLKIADVEQTPERRERQALNRVTSALAEHESGLAAWLELVDLLHQRGLLDIVIAMLKRGDGVLEILVREAEKPGGLALMKNAIALLQGMSAMDASAIARVLRHLNEGLQGATADDRPNITGVWSLLAILRDEEISAGLGALLGFLKGLGRGVMSQTGRADVES